MSFENPTALLLLVFIPLFIALFIWAGRQRQRQLARIGDLALLQTGDASAQRWKLALWTAALAALVLALARPVWGIDEEFVEVRGIAIMVLLDVSASMEAQDVLPSRLERAKLATRTLFEESQGDQVGLILFAGNAFVQFPLTSDVSTALTFLNAASTDSITRQGTALEDALRLAIESFDDRITSDKLVVLMTDGENHEGLPLEAAKDAAERDIVIHAIGFGSPEGEPLPEYNQAGELVGYKTDRAGNLVNSRLEEETLQEITNVTGGVYQRATDSGLEVVNLLNEIGQLQQGLLESRNQTRPVERFGLFVALALLALSMEMVWGRQS